MLSSLTPQQFDLLLDGLASLEGAIKALEEPPPESLVKLRKLLSHEAKSVKRNWNKPRNTLTTREVAALLHCSIRNVAELHRQKKIALARRGRRGRGRSSLYKMDSVLAYQGVSNRNV